VALRQTQTQLPPRGLKPRGKTKKRRFELDGSRDRVVAFLSGRLDTMAPARGDQCKDAVWTSFPELERLKR